MRAKFGVDARADSRLPRARRRRRGWLSRHCRHRRGDRGALINEHGAIEDFPDDVLGDNRELALLFKNLATLENAPLFDSVDELRWRGPTPSFTAFAERVGDARLLARAEKTFVA